MDPFRNAILLVLKAHAINLSPTLADASVGVKWHVASVRCQVAVRSGEWQVSGGGVHVQVNVNVYVQVRMCLCMCMCMCM